MFRVLKQLKKVFSPVTIMLIPDIQRRPLRFKIPVVVIILFFILWGAISIYSIRSGIKAKSFDEVASQRDFYKNRFSEVQSTLLSLKTAEAEFKRLFALKDREEILEALDTSDTGSLDMEVLKKQIEKAMDTVGEIRDYLRQQRDIYFATPKGSPVETGYISSNFGWRIHPKTGRRDFHSGVDIAAWPGTPVRATADGIVSFAGWSGGSGRLVVIEHGFGYTTAYAHNKKVLVKVGQKVHRGDIIAFVGSTGNTTGPHVHYEIWLDKKPVNPKPYLLEASNVK